MNNELPEELQESFKDIFGESDDQENNVMAR
jgi:hypothetical protein